MRHTPIAVFALVGMIACGGDEFTSGDAAASGRTGAGAAGPGSGPSSGSGGMGGASSASSSTGGGGASPCTCGEGMYCNQVTQQCVACSDLSRIHFGAATKQAVNNGINQVFPRVQNVGGSQLQLVYTFAAQASAPNSGDIGTIAGGPPWNGGGPAGSMINSDFNDAGPLLLPPNVTIPGVTGSDLLLFDSDRDTTTHVYVASGGVTGGPAVELPGLVNEGGGSYDGQIAYAYASPSPRAYWVTDRSTQLQLVTATEASTLLPVVLAFEGGCTGKSHSPSPWVTPEGDLLLFSELRYNAAAACQGSGASRLYYLRIDPMTGLPLVGQVAHEIQIPNPLVSAADMVTPSLSPDLCTLYFSAHVDTDFDIYLAPRN